MKTITVRVVGGLGNQLHCYAFGRAITKNSEAVLELDTESGYWADPYGRQYLLDAFPFLHVRKKKMPRTRVGRVAFKAQTKLRLCLSSALPLSWRSAIREGEPPRYRQDVHRTKYKFDTYFSGYWASYLYYEDIAEELRQELRPPRLTDSAALRVRDDIDSVRSCSIHWRSYIEERSRVRQSMNEYYRAAVRLMQSKNPKIRFFVFSDSLPMARRELAGVESNLYFVDIDTAKGNAQSLIDFILMYSCDHAIIGDSSFSWWAAWLSDREGKVVVAPSGLSPWGREWAPPHWVSLRALPEV